MTMYTDYDGKIMNSEEPSVTGDHDPCSHEGYHQFIALDGSLYGSFEVFCEDGGWYWWVCHPGCIPDGEPCGPYETSREAYEDAQGEK